MQLFQFVWDVAKSGYQWVEVPDRWGDLGGTRTVLRPIDPEKGIRTYRPLDDEPALFRNFARIDLTPEDILRFANRYGLLCTELSGLQWATPSSPLDFHYPTPAMWLNLVRWLRHHIRLWDMSENRDSLELKRLVQVDGDDVIFFSCLDDENLAQFISGRARRTTRRESKYLLNFQNEPPQKIPFAAAALYVASKVSIALRADSETGMFWSPLDHRPVFRIFPRSLWGAICLQFCQAMDRGTRYLQCIECGKWIALAPGINRSDRLTCSPTCRTKAYRGRQERARKLADEGMKPRDIAKEVGSDVEIVKKWISNKEKP